MSCLTFEVLYHMTNRCSESVVSTGQQHWVIDDGNFLYHMTNRCSESVVSTGQQHWVIDDGNFLR